MSIEATIEGTKRFASKAVAQRGMAPDAFGSLGRTGLVCSRIGFGTYRVDSREREQVFALQQALLQGCNLIDTSTNYADGQSEKAVGDVLESLFNEKVASRDELIVVSKVGYVQGENLARVKHREQKGQPFPEMVYYSENCWHCIHPEFIRHQITLSLERLRLKKVDCYLLHNPEYFLMAHLKKNGATDIRELRVHYYDRIRRAFQCLEELVAEGKIRAYGVSSNTFAYADSHPEASSLVKMWQIAEQLGETMHGAKEQHSFSYVQFPCNLFESQGYWDKNNQGQTFLELARDRNLAVLVNRPLNAMKDGRLFRLAESEGGTEIIYLNDELRRLANLEDEFQNKVTPYIKDEKLRGVKFFPWSEELTRLAQEPILTNEWDEIEQLGIRPQIQQAFQYLDQLVHEDWQAEWRIWRANYWPQALQTMAVLRQSLVERQSERAEKVNRALNQGLPEEWRKEPLERKALATVASFPGVSCVLNGMRKPRYVESSLGVLRHKLFRPEPELLRKMSSLTF